jgi:hypothetical protein
LRYEAHEYDKFKEHSKHTDEYRYAEQRPIPNCNPREVANQSSLGTIIWQIMSLQFPYEIPEPVTPQMKTAHSELQRKLSQKVLPGALENLSAGVAGIVERCWNLDPRLRPTSAEVAIALQDLMIDETLNDENTEQMADDESSVAENSISEICISELSEPLNIALKLIRKARAINLESPSIKLGSECISIDDFNMLLRGDDWTAVQYFAVGALIFWKLTNSDISAFHRTETTSPILSDEGAASLFSTLQLY